MLSEQSFFDRRAGTWEEDCYPPEVRSRLCALLPHFGVRNGERVLDIGTGPGVLIPYLCRLTGAAGRVWALDLSFEMVRQAALKLSVASDFVLQSDVHALPIKSESFDRVICFAAFPHFKHPEKAMGEMARVLRTGGTLVVAHLMSRHELVEHHARHVAVAGDLLPDHNAMRWMFEKSELLLLTLTDSPGCYLAKGIK